MIAESRTNDVIIVRTGVEHGIAFREWGDALTRAADAL
jgi:hypothetical protein